MIKLGIEELSEPSYGKLYTLRYHPSQKVAPDDRNAWYSIKMGQRSKDIAEIANDTRRLAPSQYTIISIEWSGLCSDGWRLMATVSSNGRRGGLVSRCDVSNADRKDENVLVYLFNITSSQHSMT